MTGLFLLCFRRRTNTSVRCPVQSYTHLGDFGGRTIIMLDTCMRCAIYGCRNETRADDNTTKMSQAERVGDAQSKMSNDEDVKAAASIKKKPFRGSGIDCARTYRFGPFWFSSSNLYTMFGLRTLRAVQGDKPLNIVIHTCDYFAMVVYGY